MKGLHRLSTRRWVLPAIVVLVAAHLGAAIFLRNKLTTSIIAVVVVFITMVHLGMFGSFYAWFRRRSGK
ncbi:MAG TPA: hypothetical protein VH308_08445 [Terracidiphilus sp.]|jgi:hypothetical protein|nr:hypothetical protein [Terracidiphilus sp.]